MQSATSQGTTSPVATSATGSSVSRTSISPSITPNSGTQIATGGILVLVAANAFAFLAQQ
ncbi:hypothetical protein K7432_010213 [Basidiobolus ranarum]|uniref:Uncharacterized protein n=1 Tax=Basidiobolus ranarum TaxID=34480 RepID=A0ABR2WP33_9FUNG